VPEMQEAVRTRRETEDRSGHMTRALDARIPIVDTPWSPRRDGQVNPHANTCRRR
jgi:hypothetical protein